MMMMVMMNDDEEEDDDNEMCSCIINNNNSYKEYRKQVSTSPRCARRRWLPVCSLENSETVWPCWELRAQFNGKSTIWRCISYWKKVDFQLPYWFTGGYTPKNLHGTQTLVVCRFFSFSKRVFSGSMLVFGGVHSLKRTKTAQKTDRNAQKVSSEQIINFLRANCSFQGG